MNLVRFVSNNLLIAFLFPASSTRHSVFTAATTVKPFYAYAKSNATGRIMLIVFTPLTLV